MAPRSLTARPRLALALAFGWCVGGVVPLHAQTDATKGVTPPPTAALGTIRGTIRDASGLPVVGAEIRLRLAGGLLAPRAESDDEGEYQMGRIPVGRVWLLARRIGYRPDSTMLEIGSGQTVAVPLRLERLAIELDAVRVLGRRDMTGPMAGFYRRMTTGSGRFLTLAEIERRNPANMTDIFRMVPGLRIEQRGFINHVRIRNSRCAPLVWLDGQPLYAGEVDLDAFDPRSFDGIEIYSGAASVPVEFQGSQRMSSACGTIVLWSRRGELRPKQRKKDEPTPSQRIADMLGKGEAFAIADVEAAARPDSLDVARPVYPDSLFEAMVPGRVLAEFVVAADGEPIMDTFSAVTSTHRLFIEPVRRAVREQRFIAARRQGKAVAQVIQWPFEFVPDSTARRRR
jgi:hypothetical protein